MGCPGDGVKVKSYTRKCPKKRVSAKDKFITAKAVQLAKRKLKKAKQEAAERAARARQDPKKREKGFDAMVQRWKEGGLFEDQEGLLPGQSTSTQAQFEGTDPLGFTEPVLGPVGFNAPTVQGPVNVLVPRKKPKK